MSAPDGTDTAAVLATATDASAEASTSALPTTSVTNADGPTIGRPLFESLYEAKVSLSSQSSTSAQSHPLNTSLQSLYSASSDDGRLSRDQYRQLISQIRHSVSQFAATSPALKAQRSSSASTQPSEDANTSNQLRRYISLLTETSTHTAALAHSVSPLKSVDRRQVAASSQQNAAAPFPQRLQAGVFSAASSQQPSSNWQNALDTLAALCDTLDNTAQSLGLETFSEPSPEATAAPSDGTTSTLTHTLTLGAKILVIDVELSILEDNSTGDFRPQCKLKLSYATDSAESQQTRDPRLGAVLARDVQAIADKLFGPVASGAIQQERSQVAEALANWTANLSELLVLDDFEAKATEAATPDSRQTDLFAAMQELSAAVLRVSEAEASASSATLLLDRGHGIHQLHETKPFIHAVFAQDPVSKQKYTLTLCVQALDVPAADQPSADLVKPTFPLSQQAQDLLTVAAISDPAKSLGSVKSPRDSTKHVPLHFVVRLSPPVVVSRPTAAKLASICNLKQVAPNSNAATASNFSSAGPTWFEDVLASSWSRRSQGDTNDLARKEPRCSFTLAQTVESVRSTESQGLVIDSLPLLSTPATSGDAMDEGGSARAEASTLSRLFALIEVLRDEVKVTELMHAAIASSQDASDAAATSSAELSLDDMLGSTSDDAASRIPVTLAFRTPIRGATDEAQRAPSLQLAFRVPADNGAFAIFDASISPSKNAAEVGWSLAAEATLDAKKARLDSTSSEAQGIAAKLLDLDSLEDVVLGLVDWAEKQLGQRLQKPKEASKTSFDPLTYEQQNVHAIYETIAPHFSSTRYKPWPLIPAFLSTIPEGSLGADLGCGNGKYLPIRSILALPSSAEGEATEQDLVSKRQNNSLLTVGVDRSSNLIGLARDNFGMLDNSNDASKAKQLASAEDPAGQSKKCQEVAVGDAIQSSLRTGLFDYAISIATIHHFSTIERRRASVQELIRIIEPVDAPHTSCAACNAGDSDRSRDDGDPRLNGSSGRGRFMIFVWALEQKDEGKRQFEAPNPEELKKNPEIHDPNHVKSKDRLVSYSGLQAAQRADADRKAKEKKEREEEEGENVRVTDDQDVLVPWVLTTAAKKKIKAPRAAKGKKGVGRPEHWGTKDIEAGISNLNVGASEDAEKEKKEEEEKNTIDGGEARPVYNRYYHMFRAGELEALVADAAATMPVVHRRRGVLEKMEVVREGSGWERGNWWGVWRVQWSSSSEK